MYYWSLASSWKRWASSKSPPGREAEQDLAALDGQVGGNQSSPDVATALAALKQITATAQAPPPLSASEALRRSPNEVDCDLAKPNATFERALQIVASAKNKL